MVSDRLVRLTHTPLFVLTLIISIVTLAMSASLVAHYNSVGYPNVSYRDRIRIILAASIWTTLIAIFFLVGVVVKPASVLFGIFSHLVSLGIAFILLLIGASSLTALTDKQSCGSADFDRCNIVKGLVAVTWIDTIFVFVALIAIFALGIKARSGAGMRRGVLGDA
ncbi:hypothetical protein BCR35DRAFT_310087 [Leucosporidium creatinivorum]|uniref:MARVEL domain-containing protein n=1 Tax=Leucosporidium creatinivorum TaxID=106004 RepID=A0A1Y2D7T1_9BASI|nr:hypothetical protein BCR35DRAFT_310087 [Leucosporidium creatinivorum]